jgi:predicted permease
VDRRGRVVAVVLTSLETVGLAFTVLRERSRAARVEAKRAPAGRGLPRVGKGSGFSWLDVKLGVRMLGKSPGLSIVGVIGLAVGIGISAGFFSFLYSHLYPSIPLPDGDRIVALENRDIAIGNENRRSFHDFVIWRDELESMVDVSAFRTVTRSVSVEGGAPEPVSIAEMTASGFRVAGVAPLLGRTLQESDEHLSSPAVVVIGFDEWQERFAADPGVLGREVRIGNTLHTVVGVMPEGFGFPFHDSFWTPLRINPTRFARGQGPEIYTFARLAPGRTRAEAQAELTVIGRRTAAAFPETNEHLRPSVMTYTYPLLDIQDIDLVETGTFLFMVSLILVVVAANVGVLTWARTAMRRGEIAVRSALGASRRRIVAQLFVEALVLTGIAALVGLALAQFGLRLGDSIMWEETGGIPFWVDYGLSLPTVLYVVALAMMSALIIGVVPALQATGRRLQSVLRPLSGSTGHGLGRLWTVLIVAQVAIGVAGLPAVVTMGWSEIRNALTAPVIAADEFMLVSIAVDDQPDPDVDAEAWRTHLLERYDTFRAQFVARLGQEPAVRDVTFAMATPGRERQALIEVEGAPPPADATAGHRVRSGRVDARFFDVLGATVAAGRNFDAGDVAAQTHVVVVNSRFVDGVLGGAGALGRRIRYVGAESAGAPQPEGQPAPWYEIVGVVDDLHENPFDPELVSPTIYHPLAPAQSGGALLILHVPGEKTELARRLQSITRSLDADFRLWIRSYGDLDRQATLAVRLVGLMTGLTILVVLLLAAAGIYALMSFTVTQRRREIGIRSALGAHPRRLLAGVLARAIGQIALGVIVGVVIAGLGEFAMDGEFMDGKGVLLLPVVAVLMASAGLIATIGPARRGLRIHPTEALRDE